MAIGRRPCEGGQVLALAVSAWFFQRDRATLFVASVADATSVR